MHVCCNILKEMFQIEIKEAEVPHDGQQNDIIVASQIQCIEICINICITN